MFTRTIKTATRRILKSAIFLSLLTFAFIGCENPANVEVEKGSYLDTLAVLPAKQYFCKVDTTGRFYVGQYRPITELAPQKTTQYMYLIENQDVDQYDASYLLINNSKATKTPVTCQL